MAHAHTHGQAVSVGRLAFTAGLNVVITGVEVAGGLLSGSLALLSDAAHNAGDALAVLVALVALLVARRRPTARLTFGWQRAEILAALFNAATLLVVLFFLFREAVERFAAPRPVDGALMLGVAAVGLVANGLAVTLLHRDKAKSLNLRAAYLHLVGDTVSSLAVILGAVAMLLWGAWWLDPALTVLVGLFVLKGTLAALGEALGILMQAAPAGADPARIKADLERLPGVVNVHHVHVWSLADASTCFDGHVQLAAGTAAGEVDGVRRAVTAALASGYGITHATVQVEYENCCCEDAVH